MSTSTQRIDAVRAALIGHFGSSCITHQITDDLFVITTPLARYDDFNVILFAADKKDFTLLHDGGRTLSYLSDYGINLLSTSQQNQKFYDYFADLAKRHDIRLSKEFRRLELDLPDANDGRRTLAFIECIIALSYLVMLKKTGIVPLQAQRKLTVLGTAIKKAMPELEIRHGMRTMQQTGEPLHPWGLSVWAPETRKKACLQLLGGETEYKVFQSTLITGALFHVSNKWLDVPPTQFIALYDGPPKLFPTTKKWLQDFRNSSEPTLIDITETQEVLTRLARAFDLHVEKGRLNEIQTEFQSQFAHKQTKKAHNRNDTTDYLWTEHEPGARATTHDEEHAADIITRLRKQVAGDPLALTPTARYTGIVADIEEWGTQDAARIRYIGPDGSSFTELFPRKRLAAVEADYAGAQLEYLIYNVGQFTITEVRNTGYRYAEALQRPLNMFSAEDLEELQTDDWR